MLALFPETRFYFSELAMSSLGVFFRVWSTLAARIQYLRYAFELLFFPLTETVRPLPKYLYFSGVRLQFGAQQGAKGGTDFKQSRTKSIMTLALGVRALDLENYRDCVRCRIGNFYQGVVNPESRPSHRGNESNYSRHKLKYARVSGSVLFTFCYRLFLTVHKPSITFYLFASLFVDFMLRQQLNQDDTFSIFLELINVT